ncbi:SRPBCC family protein [Gloeocapsa sp. PCC 73106]|uniref:SRPBCC family protein n=1 Tax=Gloeocapsa sp. PCC 73106 TaxID=102232 RepID=UPI0002AC6344|nr:SRPBCC family protein [Gloeocapsa sp. PCC 73106]ELR97466.1 polyketide cyclase / dehydrase family protein [Gloeocapsa sp. PCC 73106]
MLSFSLIAITTQLLLNSPQSSHSLSQPVTISQAEVNSSRVIFSGAQGEYTCSVAVTGDLDSIWTVLTDYDNFAEYMPNVVESKLIHTQGNQKVFTQVQIFRLLLLSIRSQVTIDTTEDYPREIKFTLVDGNLKHLNGSWTIRPMSSNRFLVTHKVSVEPNLESSDLRAVFFNVYEDTLKKTLEVVRQEAEKRSFELGR